MIYLKCFFVFVKFTLFDFFYRQSLCSFHLFLYTLKKKSEKIYNNLGIRAVIIYFALLLLIWLKSTKITKIFIPVILFYGNIYFLRVCVRFAWWLLCVFWHLEHLAFYVICRPVHLLNTSCGLKILIEKGLIKTFN